ncbi:MAG: DUF4198 domain-containing protein [Candidatus Electrothrix sp. GW3-4]|uniref:DUF4198 domain-containing protein n=1 Tax=Candidatus Electrothrix sp. GW3-4 TaxID=3126740 RepID=UPI0030D34D31
MGKRRATLIISLALIVLSSSQAFAHFPWINTDGYTHHSGGTPHISIGWGHRYPLGRFLRQEDLENMSLRGPGGYEISLKASNSMEFEPEEALSTPGTYTVAAQRKTGFYTKTTEGGKRQSKEGLSNVLHCSRSHMTMKALLTVGETEEAEALNTTPVGHPLEIIPQASPASLRAGDYFPVLLLLYGKPYQGKLFATYMGFSTEKDVFAYTAKTDKKGMGKIRILQPGVWLIKAEYQEPYSDQQVCDVESFSATLTLEIQ